MSGHNFYSYPGLVLALAGKTIEISFDSLPTGVNIV
jgi:hypothetical protein